MGRSIISDAGAAGFRFESVARSHVGMVRSVNEDRFLDRSDMGLWAVADGMGGHECGDLAATMLVEVLGEIGDTSSGHDFLSAVSGAVQRVNSALIVRAAAMPQDSIIGSTIVVLMVREGHYGCLWAGDSRAYLFRGGRLEQITHDHSFVQELVDRGLLDPEAARYDPRANLITRAVGVDQKLEPEVRQAPVEPGDLFLLCSDGLTGMLSDREIADLLAEAALERAADDLLNKTLNRGAPDNVTLVLVRASTADKSA